MPKRIVVVDDDREVQEILSFALVRYGFEVECARDGRQLQRCLATGRERLPDLIILDVMMPGEDGYHICRGLREDERTKHIPIIIVTARIENIYKRISEDIGVSTHVTKPFHPIELVEKVQAVLGETWQRAPHRGKQASDIPVSREN